MPDLLHHWLSGARGVEFTNATTTQMLDWRTGTWDVDLLQALDLPTHMLPPIVAPGTRLGTPLPACVARAPRLDGVPVIAPACHDTGSAVASVPSGGGVAFLSSGTWSLLGTETPRTRRHRRRPSRTTSPTKAASPAPRGVLRNITGLWVLEGCLRGWRAEGQTFTVEDVLAGAAQRPVCQSVIDPDDSGVPPGAGCRSRAGLVRPHRSAGARVGHRRRPRRHRQPRAGLPARRASALAEVTGSRSTPSGSSAAAPATGC